MRDSSHECADFFTLYLALFFWGSHDNVDGRLWTLACSATISTRIHLRSAPPLGHSIPYHSLMNFVTFFISSNNQTPQLSHHHHHHPSIVIYHPIQNIYHPLYSYSSRIITRCRLFLPCLFIITFSPLSGCSFTSVAFLGTIFPLRSGKL
jgi:hypothetical protein